MDIKPMTFHKPGWVLDLGDPERGTDKCYMVWGPGEIVHQDHPTGRYRTGWQSSWDSHAGQRGNVVKGDTLDEVLRIFPENVAQEFRRVIG